MLISGIAVYGYAAAYPAYASAFVASTLHSASACAFTFTAAPILLITSLSGSGRSEMAGLVGACVKAPR